MKSVLAAASVVTLVGAMATTPATAVVVWDEAIDGDLSPGSEVTAVSLSLGLNTIVGDITTIAPPAWGDGVGADWILDLDPVSLRLPASTAIVAAHVRTVFFDVTSNTASYDMDWSFIAQGKVFTTCFGLLPAQNECAVAPGGGSLNFSRPLAQWPLLTQGSRFPWVDGALNSGGKVYYELDLQVASIPEPATTGMLLAGIGALVLATQGRRQRR